MRILNEVASLETLICQDDIQSLISLDYVFGDICSNQEFPSNYLEGHGAMVEQQTFIIILPAHFFGALVASHSCWRFLGNLSLVFFAVLVNLDKIGVCFQTKQLWLSSISKGKVRQSSFICNLWIMYKQRGHKSR